MSKIISKIAVTAINGVSKGFKKVVARSLAMRIVGVVHSSVPTEMQTEFKGEFRAWNAKGEIFVAPKCVLPFELQAMVSKALADAGKGKAVSVAADVYLVPDSQVALGYLYEISTLVAPMVFNPLDELLNKIPEFVVQQPPEATAEKAAEKIAEGKPEEPKAEKPATPAKKK